MLKLVDQDTLQIEVEKTADDNYTPYFEYETLPLTDELRLSVRRIYQLRNIEGDSGRFTPDIDDEEARVLRLFDGPTCRSKGKWNFNWTWWDDITDHYPREFIDALVELLHPSKTDAPAQGLIWSLPGDD